jgi:hypothetical protein
MEDHSMEQQEEVDGIGYLGEGFGEGNHQDQVKADRHLGCVCWHSFVAQEKSKAWRKCRLRTLRCKPK